MSEVDDEIILLVHSQIERHSDREHPFGECLCSGCDTNKRVLELLGVQLPGHSNALQPSEGGTGA